LVASDAESRQGPIGLPLVPPRAAFPVRDRSYLPSTRDALEWAVARVRTIARTCGYSADRRTNLEIALREALANAIDHGNASQPERRVFLRCYAGRGAGLLVCVRDEGPGFDPDQVPDPRAHERRELNHGRGLLLMRSLSDGMAFRHGGREVTLYFGPYRR
jgi:serine/threonine-protein kinase RsbW